MNFLYMCREGRRRRRRRRREEGGEGGCGFLADE